MLTAVIYDSRGTLLQTLEATTKRGLFEYCASEYGACIGKKLHDSRRERVWVFGSCAQRITLLGERVCLDPFIVYAVVRESGDE